jgi:TRAP-type C4-dicarboxylate transport system permease small subunit
MSPTPPDRGLAAALLTLFSRLEAVLTTFAFALLVAVMFADVFMRWVTGSGILWAREVGVFANIVITIVGIGVASAHGAHLRPRFMDRCLPARWEPAIVAAQHGLTALAFASLAVLASTVVADTFEFEERSNALRWLMWPIQAVLPLAFTLAASRHSIYAFHPALRPREEAA